MVVATISRLLKLQVSVAKEPYKRDYNLQKRPVIFSSFSLRESLRYGSGYD